MTKYVRLNSEKTEWTSAIFTNIPRNVARWEGNTERFTSFGWHQVKEHKEPLPDNELYSFKRDSWELIDDVVHVYFTPELKSLEERQNVMSQRCTDYRDRRLVSGLFFAGREFDTRRETLTRILGKWTAAALDPNQTTEWITQANDIVFLDNQAIFMLGHAYEQFEGDNILYCRRLKNIIESSESPETIDITEGWPSNDYYPDVELPTQL